jgi:hypothetical protein
MNDTKFIKCTCNVCSGGLEFDPADSGSTIQCPHCGMETVLFFKPPETNPPKPKSQKQTARIVRPDLIGGQEDTVQSWGTFLCILGIVGAIASLFLVKDDIYMLAVTFACVVQAMAAKIFCDVIAEIIRILKKIAGLKYGGSISDPWQPKLFCSRCGRETLEIDKTCSGCKSVFLKD